MSFPSANIRPPVRGSIPLSIVVPVYNASKFLPETFRSIKDQAENVFECILVDDGSTDGSGELCDRACEGDARFRVIHQENAGEYMARKTGIQAATGRYLAFLDADDILLENAVTQMLKKSVSDEVPTVHVFEFCSVSSSGATAPQNRRRRNHASAIDWKRALADLLSYRYPPTMCGKVWPKSWFAETTDSLILKIGADLHMTAELLIKNRGWTRFHDDVVYGYRANPESAIHKNDFSAAYSSLSEALERLLRDCGLDSEFSDELATFRSRNVFAASWKENKLPSRHDIARMVSDFHAHDLNMPDLERRFLNLYSKSPFLGNVIFGLKLSERRIRTKLNAAMRRNP